MNAAQLASLTVAMPMLLIAGIAHGGTPSLFPVAAAMRRMASSN